MRSWGSTKPGSRSSSVQDDSSGAGRRCTITSVGSARSGRAAPGPIPGAAAGSLSSDRGFGRPCLLDVPGDLLHELRLALERALLAQPPPKLHREPRAVEIALPVEEVRLDPALGAAVVRVDADRDRGPPVADGTRVDPVLGHEQLRIDAEVRRREAKGASALVAADDDPVELEWSPEELGRLPHLAGVRECTDRRR